MMTTYITLDQFIKLFPKAKDPKEWVDLMNKLFPRYQIITPDRVVAFISQCGVETAGWTKFEENLNYSANRMMEVWPKIFDENLAKQCEYKPRLIANHAYANRMGNKDVVSGDGWKFRGRGPIHLTGKENYEKFANAMFEDPGIILQNPDIVALDKQISLQSALWFWNKNNLNKIADSKEIIELTRKINGGLNGLQERINLSNLAYKILYKK